MKKLISLFTVLLFILSGCLWFSTDTYADETKSSDSETAASETVPETQASPVILPTDKVSTDDIILYSSAACVIDVDSGEILYYKNMDDRHYPASITKVLTGLLLIENANLDDTITFSQDCWNGLNYYNDMNIGILDGEQLTVNELIELMSGNTSVLKSGREQVSKKKLATTMRDIIFEYNLISDPAGARNFLLRAEEKTREEYNIRIFGMCEVLLRLEKYSNVREILTELELNADSMSDKRVAAEVKSRLARAKKNLADLEEEDKPQPVSDIRNSFDEQTAALMVHFKFQIDTAQMKASVYAHLIVRYKSEVKARLAAMKQN